jgi:hypothetical protein
LNGRTAQVLGDLAPARDASFYSRRASTGDTGQKEEQRLPVLVLPATQEVAGEAAAEWAKTSDDHPCRSEPAPSCFIKLRLHNVRWALQPSHEEAARAARVTAGVAHSSDDRALYPGLRVEMHGLDPSSSVAALALWTLTSF